MNRTSLCAPLALLTALGSPALAQTNFPEVEPNGVRTEATLVNGIAAGDTITGASTGTLVVTNSTAANTVDMFRVKTAPLPLAIYKHTLTLTSAVSGHSPTLRGLQQANGVISATDATLQPAALNLSLARTNSWYGFGRQEELYYRVAGTVSTTANYVATLSTTPISPVVVAGTFSTGNIQVTTVAQGHTSDTEIFVYDANLDPVALGHNDDLIGGVGSVSDLSVPLAPGTYYVAVADWNTANNQSDANPTEGSDDGNLLDFPNALANGTLVQNVNVSFAISDGTNTTAVPATKGGVHEIVWAVFTVVPASTPSTAFCSGDAVGTTCLGCGNNGFAGRGCANSSFPAGALLSSLGIAGVSAGTDTLVLTATGIPGPGLFFQGSGLAASPISFGDGMLCAAVGIIRMGVVFPTSGSASYPGGLTPNPIHVAGGPLNAGDTRHYQCWYRDAVAFCTASTFNTSNGVTLTWVP